jgi:hypothetical protein
MKQAQDEHRFFYVDETGDASFYGKDKKTDCWERRVFPDLRRRFSGSGSLVCREYRVRYFYGADGRNVMSTPWGTVGANCCTERRLACFVASDVL